MQVVDGKLQLFSRELQSRSWQQPVPIPGSIPVVSPPPRQSISTPLTRQQRLHLYLQQQQQIQHIQQTKSKKLLFNNPGVDIRISRRMQVQAPNRWFRFVGVPH